MRFGGVATPPCGRSPWDSSRRLGALVLPLVLPGQTGGEGVVTPPVVALRAPLLALCDWLIEFRIMASSFHLLTCMRISYHPHFTDEEITALGVNTDPESFQISCIYFFGLYPQKSDCWMSPHHFKDGQTEAQRRKKKPTQGKR